MINIEKMPRRARSQLCAQLIQVEKEIVEIDSRYAKGVRKDEMTRKQRQSLIIRKREIERQIAYADYMIAESSAKRSLSTSQDRSGSAYYPLHIPNSR
jgi:hypothetical protein